MKIQGIAAVVTGAASGLGEATARELARRGAKVALFDRDVDKGEKVASEIGGVFCEVDVTSDDKVAAAFAKARAGDGPSLIECLTYRHSGHSRADPAKYRPEGELEKWKERDPVKIYRERLKQFGVDDKAIVGIETEVRKIVDDATDACKAAPMPPLDILTTDVYADGGWAWRN